MGAFAFLSYAFLVLPMACDSGAKGMMHPGLAPLDKARNAQERAVLLSANNRQSFPRLGTNFEVLAPATAKYNCISHSLGTHSQWISPKTGPDSNPLAYMDQLYQVQGYVRLATPNISREAGKQKLVVYATRGAEGKIKAITHSAVQAADGSWQSKLGELPLIRHLTLSALSGPLYGSPVAVYVRKQG